MPIKKAGFLKTTLIDYPGKIASTIFLRGCNLRCPYCHNRDLVLGTDETLIPVEEILEYLDKRKKIIQGVCISGGEPLIHDDLPELVSAIRALGYSIKLDTNGLLPEKLLNSSPDYIAMDIKTAPSKYYLVSGKSRDNDKTDYEGIIRKSVRMIIESRIRHEFRTTVVPGIVAPEDVEIIADIARGCEKYTLNRYSPMNTLDESYMDIIPYTEEGYARFTELFEKNGIKAVFRGS